MVFSSIIFLFAFLPIVLTFVLLGPKEGNKSITWRNLCLVIASFIFYAWGESWLVLVLFLVAWINYILGKKIQFQLNSLHNPIIAKRILIVGIVFNLALLGGVKYGAWLTNEVLSLINALAIFPEIQLIKVWRLPLGISFFIFQAISYIIDAYRNSIKVAETYIDFSCYLTMFSQLVAGPIVRYADIAQDIKSYNISLDNMYAGLQRFVLGLGKKVLIANQVALIADMAFSLSMNELNTPLAWIGIIAYALQIYYDFSAYSDMAIGLGLMFGFHFLENFKHPYASFSIQEFWRRWHISLSTWFKDYVYIPLGGNRVSPRRTYINLFIVFFLCGLWHGASFNFVFWGVWQGLFLVIERAGLSRILKQIPKIFQFTYVWVVFLFGWVLFRAETIPAALDYYQALLGLNPDASGFSFALFEQMQTSILMLFIGFIGCLGLPASYFLQLRTYFSLKSPKAILTFEIVVTCFGALLLLISTAFLISGSYNPFIYFRF